MRVLPVFLIGFALTASAQTREWLPLEEALTRARASERLVLLYLPAGTKADKTAEEWLTAALTHDAIAHSVDDMVLARAEYRDAIIRHYEEIAVIAKHRDPHLVVLDPGGGVVTELYAFKSFGSFAAALSALRTQAETFAGSARVRAEGKPANAYFARGLGLANAGAYGAANTAFRFAADVAHRAGDPVMEQRAQLGLASLELDSQGHSNDGMRHTLSIAEHALAPDIAADAWLLVGDRRRVLGDARGALEAFSKSYAAAAPGSSLSDMARHKLDAMGAPLPGAGTQSSHVGRVHLIFQRRTVMAGSVEAVATAPVGTARVEFLVDDARITDSTRAPYHAHLPLGSTPRVHTLRAVAYDERDRRIGDDAVTINEHVERLGVEIVTPKSDDVASVTEVEVAPHVPEGDVLEGVDIFWNETLLVTLREKPFRTELKLPSPNAFGYLRVVAHSRGGATAEDAKLINSVAMMEATRVDAIEVYAIVQDHRGHNIEGLTARDFDVREDGRRVDVALHGSATDPITVGIALDTSGSMRAAMMDVAEDARIFLRDSLAPGDKTLLVAFDDEPHLVQPLTDDRQHVSAQIFDTRPRGSTAVWDAVAFSLTQLKGVGGKRALLVFTDGADNGSTATPAGVSALAREAGVPVYLVLMFSTVYGTSIKAQVARERRYAEYGRLAETSGGALFLMPKQTDFPRLFAQVRDDTRGEYILTFVSQSTRPRGEPRTLKVALPGKRAVIRAPSSVVVR